MSIFMRLFVSLIVRWFQILVQLAMLLEKKTNRKIFGIFFFTLVLFLVRLRWLNTVRQVVNRYPLVKGFYFILVAGVKLKLASDEIIL